MPDFRSRLAYFGSLGVPTPEVLQASRIWFGGLDWQQTPVASLT
jgi:hypothetical protein